MWDERANNSNDINMQRSPLEDAGHWCADIDTKVADTNTC